MPRIAVMEEREVVLVADRRHLGGGPARLVVIVGPAARPAGDGHARAAIGLVGVERTGRRGIATAGSAGRPHTWIARWSAWLIIPAHAIPLLASIALPMRNTRLSSGLGQYRPGSRGLSNQLPE